jgi:hypothetical protein
MAQSDGSIILSTKVDTKGLKKGITKIKEIAATGGKALLAVGAAATAATVAVTTAAVKAYSEYEQLIGGVETLFKDSAEKVTKYAENAFFTAGMSMSEYMQTAIGVSASLIQSLGGDTAAAAEVANMAIIDMSDNVNKLGTDAERVQMAYAGFARQQYVLLDNLALGYQGTKTEMERLLKDAEQYMASQGKTVKYSINNLSDVYSAIHAIQEKMGIAGTTMAEAEKTISGSAKMTKAAWANVLTAISGGGDLDKAMNNFVYSIGKMFDNLVPVIERSLYALGDVINWVVPQLVTMMANVIVRMLPSLVMTIYNAVLGMLQGLWQGIKDVLKGKKIDLAAQLNEVTGSVTTGANAAADGMENLGDETEEAGKKAKKALAGFDDLQILSSNAATAAETPIPTPDVGANGTGNENDENALDQAKTEISNTLSQIMAIVGDLMIALGVLVLFLGNIPLGIGLIAFGAVSMGIGMAQLTENGVESKVVSGLSAIMGFVGGALIAIGIMLLFLGVGSLPVAIGLIVAGAALLVGSAGTMTAFQPSDVEGWLGLIMAIAAGALIALGIILCMVGSAPLGVGLIIAGAVSLVGAVAINSEAFTSQITGWIAVILGIVGAALLVLGIILTCSGSLPLGIALIAAGAVALVTPIALNWDLISEKIQGTVGGILAIVGTAFLVLGIILVATGNLPLGIALIVAGAGSLVAVVTANWNTILDWVKNAWKGIKDFWNEHIAKIFTKEWWLSLAKKAGNGLISGFEKAINGIIGMFENMINWVVRGLNKISFDVPDWVPGIGGKTFGFNLDEVKFDRVKIPRLATGAVIPANREFLAVLGDQKHGTNIEAPAELIKQMAKEAMLEIGGIGQPTREEHYYLNETELMSIVYKLFKGGQRLQGTSLIKEGTY